MIYSMRKFNRNDKKPLPKGIEIAFWIVFGMLLIKVLAIVLCK